MNTPVLQALGADYFGPAFGPQGQTTTGSGFDWGFVINTGTNILDTILNRNRPVQPAPTDTAMVDKLLAQAKTNQMILLGGGALVAVGLIGFKLLAKK